MSLMAVVLQSCNWNLEKIYYLFQIVSAVAVIFGAVIALIQYIKNSKEAEKQRTQELKLFELQIQELKKDRMQRAIDLSEYYKNNVIYYMNILKYVYDRTGITQIVSKIPEEKLCHFDVYELEENLTTQDLKILRNFMDNKEFTQALINASETAGFWPECRDIVLKEENGKKIKEINVRSRELKYRFGIMVQDVLNNLEYFAMAFTHKTADESVVYQSLHSNYMMVIKLLYYDIASNNIPGEAKLFTNIIDLYNIWKKETEKRKAVELAAKRENISKGNVLKKS